MNSTSFAASRRTEEPKGSALESVVEHAGQCDH
jgi:hypothetical protein